MERGIFFFHPPGDAGNRAAAVMMQKQSVRIFPTRRGARVIQHGTVLSEVLDAPGPTHSVADVVAAILHLLSPGPRVAMLGFAAGGLLAPLRKLGSEHEIDAVDISDGGFHLFERLMSPWAGEVRFVQSEASEWLQREGENYHAILDDLSIGQDGDVIKPEISWERLPGLMKRRLHPGGLAISNLLRPPQCSWKTGLCRAANLHSAAIVVEVEGYENRILVARDLPLLPREFSRKLRGALRALSSRLAGRVRVRTLRCGISDD
jgi:hypothetical protein